MDRAPAVARTMVDAARTSAGSAANAALAELLAKIFEQESSAAAAKFLASRSCSRGQRRQLAELACLEQAWRECDQTIPGNVQDLAATLVTELYEPFWFYRSTLLGAVSDEQPRSLFGRRLATPPLRQGKRDRYWMARSGTVRNTWLPGLPSCEEQDAGASIDATFDAVVHFVQAGSGTGVHIGGGRVLTCAHVVDCRDDDNMDEDDVPVRLRRNKLLMFASGRTFIAECAAVLETTDGVKDVALVALGAEVDVSSLPTSHGEAMPGGGTAASGASAASWRGRRTKSKGKGGEDAAMVTTGAVVGEPLPAAAVAQTAATLGERLFCVGNPSNVDLESLAATGSIEFEPPTWHASVGMCEGYLDPSVQAAAAAQQARGRAPTRGELKSILDASPVGATEGTYMHHSCWTYWGHSGAPLFDEEGRVTGLHCAWDDRTGARHGQKLQHLLDTIASAGEPALEQTAARIKVEGKAGKKRRRKAENV
eukprot:COSAG02_NODE_153_length_33128_cov_10.471253_12_plen_482_part_00